MIRDLKPTVSKGAYYILADISRIEGGTTTEKVINLLKQTGIATVPGKAFYHAVSDMHLVRFCFSKKEKELDEACRRLRELI